jgi:hypothetical protein
MGCSGCGRCARPNNSCGAGYDSRTAAAAPNYTNCLTGDFNQIVYNPAQNTTIGANLPYGVIGFEKPANYGIGWFFERNSLGGYGSTDSQAYA